MGRIESFRDLVAWQVGMELASATYQWTAHFPARERFGLISQMQRSAASVPCNIAEGWWLGTKPLFLRQLRVARGSLAELETQIELSSRVLGLQPPSDLLLLRVRAAQLLQGLMSSIERRQRAEDTDR